LALRFGCIDAVDAQFPQKKAARELSRYRTEGRGVTTKLLRHGFRSAGQQVGTVLTSAWP
jgi:hypothetical protein